MPEVIVLRSQAWEYPYSLFRKTFRGEEMNCGAEIKEEPVSYIENPPEAPFSANNNPLDVNSVDIDVIAQGVYEELQFTGNNNPLHIKSEDVEEEVRNRFTRHYRVHTFNKRIATKNILCEMCPFKTTEIRYLKKHMNIHCPKYSCEKCDFQSSCLSQMKRHVLTHSNTKQKKEYKCGVCDEEKILPG
ncbi:hypothetical protein JTB14_033413 [Gonioctena quinquepunctata]|nr:hypothetical protein JTB14_033413 [Gonioctena quinquepunctata]